MPRILLPERPKGTKDEVTTRIQRPIGPRRPWFDKMSYKHASFLRGASLILGGPKRPKDVEFYDFPKMDLDSQSPREIYTFSKFTIISLAAIKD